METFFVGGESTKWRHFSLVEILLNGDIFQLVENSTKWSHFSLVENLLNGDIFRWWRIY